jgi:hypothetical protein
VSACVFTPTTDKLTIDTSFPNRLIQHFFSYVERVLVLFNIIIEREYRIISLYGREVEVVVDSQSLSLLKRLLKGFSFAK